jgi:O-antigen ligase
MPSKQITNLYINYQNTLFVGFFIGGILKAIIDSYIAKIDITLLITFLVLFDAILMLFVRVRKLKFNLITLIPTIILFLFYLFFFISLLYTRSEFYGYQKTAFFFINLLCFFYPFLIIEFRLNVFKNLIKFIVLPLSVFFIYSRHQYWLPHNEHIRLAKEGFYNISGLYLALGSTVSLYIITMFFSYKKQWFLILTSFLILFALGSRGPLIFLVFTLFLMNLKSIVNKIMYLKIRTRTYFIIITSLSLIPIGLFKYKDQIAIILKYGIYRFTSLFNIGADTSTLGRIERMNFALDYSFSSFSSFLFGNGIGSFGILYSGKDVREYPHNIIIETLFELGIIPTLLISLFLIYPFVIRGDKIYKALALFMLLDSFKSGNLTDLWILFGLYGLAIFVRKNKKEINLLDQSLV